MEVGVVSELNWDPYNKTIDIDPYPLWRRMRDEQPVYRNDKFDFYALPRYADVDAALRDPGTFSSAYGTVLELMSSNPMPSGYMIFSDPPGHNTLRALVSRAFTPRRVAALEDYIRSLCVEMLDRQVGGSGFDYVQDFAAQLPSMVISELIGVDPADREEIRRTIDLSLHMDDEKGMINDISFGAQIKMRTYFIEQLEARRASPRDDMMTGLVNAEVATEEGTRKLTTDEAASLTCEMVGAGTETVVRLLGWAASLLAAHPDQRATLAADPSLMKDAVEETLRYEAPSPVQGRTVLRDIELHGTKIPEGSRVLLLTASANRDERKWSDPDRYDIRRRADNHVSFSHGLHFCLGASLARMEGRVALEETLRRFPTWEIDYENAVQQHTSTVRGFEKLPIVF
jgi:cytochrome P450